MIPVNIISGFLGSGKTTAIINLLQQKTAEEKWAVIINEFGKVSIDGLTLKSRSDSGSVFDISGGCICCSAKGYFHDNLLKIVESGEFDRIIIEPSGLGGIDMVIEIAASISELRILPLICMVDITSINNPRLRMNLIYQSQITKAEVIVFSKCDLLPDLESMNHSIAIFKKLFPGKNRCVQASESDLSILQMNHTESNSNNSLQFLSAPKSDLTIENFQENNFQFDMNTVFDSEKLARFFSDHPSIIRAKGYIQTENGWNLVNFTLSGCIFENCHLQENNELVLITESAIADLKLNSELENCILAT